MGEQQAQPTWEGQGCSGSNKNMAVCAYAANPEVLWNSCIMALAQPPRNRVLVMIKSQ